MYWPQTRALLMTFYGLSYLYIIHSCYEISLLLLSSHFSLLVSHRLFPLPNHGASLHSCSYRTY
jgi:hypothetical protein